MRRPRITIAHLVLVVLIAGLALAAVRSGSPAWAGAMLSVTLFVMTCSLLGAALERGMPRVYWSGFAALGWTYLFLTYAPWLNERVGAALLAPNLFESLHEVLSSSAPQPPGGLQSVPVGPPGAAVTAGGFGGVRGVPPFGYVSDFVRIGVSIEALLWAFLGGWVACRFASGPERRRNSEPTTPVTTPAAGGLDQAAR